MGSGGPSEKPLETSWRERITFKDLPNGSNFMALPSSSSSLSVTLTKSGGFEGGGEEDQGKEIREKWTTLSPSSRIPSQMLPGSRGGESFYMKVKVRTLKLDLTF